MPDCLLRHSAPFGSPSARITSLGALSASPRDAACLRKSRRWVFSRLITILLFFFCFKPYGGSAQNGKDLAASLYRKDAKTQRGIINFQAFSPAAKDLSRSAISSRIRRKTSFRSSSEPRAVAGSSRLQWRYRAGPGNTGQLSRALSHTVIT